MAAGADFLHIPREMRPMLLREWDYRDPAGWIVQEKFDGIRAVWTGSQLLTREGNVVPCPEWFTYGFPDHPLDGELWIDRNAALPGMLSVFGSGLRGDWSRVRFVVFDAPSEDPIETRLCRLSMITLPPHCEIAPHWVCRDECHLEDILDEIATRGGEGIVLRAPGSPYEHQRSGHARKLRLSPRAQAAA